PTPLRTIARITAFRPGQSPPPVRTPIRMGESSYSHGGVASAVEDLLAQYRLHVDDRGAVDRLQVPHLEPEPLDREDLDPMQADRVRPVRGARREDAGGRSRGVAARMDDQHVSVGAIEPGQDQQLVA